MEEALYGALSDSKLTQDQHHTDKNKDQTERVGDPPLVDISRNEKHIRWCN